MGSSVGCSPNRYPSNPFLFCGGTGFHHPLCLEESPSLVQEMKQNSSSQSWRFHPLASEISTGEECMLEVMDFHLRKETHGKKSPSLQVLS